MPDNAKNTWSGFTTGTGGGGGGIITTSSLPHDESITENANRTLVKNNQDLAGNKCFILIFY